MLRGRLSVFQLWLLAFRTLPFDGMRRNLDRWGYGLFIGIDKSGLSSNNRLRHLEIACSLRKGIIRDLWETQKPVKIPDLAALVRDDRVSDWK